MMLGTDITTFDTHKHVKDCKANGFTEKQAEAVVRIVMDSREYDFSKLATKEQMRGVEDRLGARIFLVEERLSSVEERLDAKISAVEERLDAKITMLGSELRQEIANMQTNIVKWAMPIMMANMAMIASILVKVFLK